MGQTLNMGGFKMKTKVNFREVLITAGEADQEDSGWYGPFLMDDDTASWVQDALDDNGLDLLVGFHQDEEGFQSEEVYVKVAPKPTEVESSMMEKIAYDAATQQLSVTFKSGNTYHYFDVEQPIYEGLEQAKSKGKFFTRHIRPWYEYKRVE